MAEQNATKNGCQHTKDLEPRDFFSEDHSTQKKNKNRCKTEQYRGKRQRGANNSFIVCKSKKQHSSNANAKQYRQVMWFYMKFAPIGKQYDCEDNQYGNRDSGDNDC